MWRLAVRVYPKASFYINLLGYDEDPLELHEISKVTRYVRLWAHHTGIEDAKDVHHLVGDVGVGWLAACGVPAEDVKVALPPKTSEH
jgi:hypothetical protein